MAAIDEAGRDAFERGAWAEAYESLATAGELDPASLERLAQSAYLVGKDAESDRAWQLAHAGWLRAGDSGRAARCAFWLGLGLLLRGESAPAAGWLQRSARLAQDLAADHVVHGYLLVPASLAALHAGDAGASYRLCVTTAGIAESSADADLLALARLGQAEASVALGETRQGLALLDEVMVGVTTGEVSAVVSGLVYCAVIATCLTVFDVHRAAEWTEALRRWCDEQPGLVPYRGQCLVHRSQILRANGAWTEAADEAGRACEWLSRPLHPALGMALYQRAELHRLRGEFDDAEAAYRGAAGYGGDAMPGLALLQLARGDRAGAAAAVRRALGEVPAGASRPALLEAYVEIMLAVGDVPAARDAAAELATTAEDIGAPLLHAMAAHAAGAVRLAGGDARAAVAGLRDAIRRWRALDMPYETARSQLLVGEACRALGDGHGCRVELDAARAVFERLGAQPDLDRLAALEARGPGSAVLTDRECEVLKLVASGATNREIGGALGISEHTVARHLQNIFTKIGAPSRAAATAYAYEHRLV